VFKIQSGNSIHCALLGTASVLAMSAFSLSTPAFGQAAPGATAASTAPIETVVVTGIRASLKSAQSIKKNADQIVDSVTAVDIGALPDRSVAEALQRVPGVTVQRTDQNRDPVRFAGAPNTVFIRGLSWVQSELNGRDVFSASNGRALSFGDVSSDLLAGVDVYKNPDAKMIEGGVGGTVDLRTRRPFDQDGFLAAVSAEYDTGNLFPRSTPSVNGLVSDRWDTKIGEIGALLSVDYQDLATRSNGFAFDHYDCVNIATNTVNGARNSPACDAVDPADRRFIPDTISWRQIDWEQKRTALDGAVQWRPNNAWEFTLDAIVSIADPHDVEHTQSNNSEGMQVNDPSYKYSPDGTWIGGSQSNAKITGDTRIGRRHESTGSYSWNAKFTPNDSWTATGDIEYIESEATNYSMTGFTGLADCGGFANGLAGPCETMTVSIPQNGHPFISQTPKAGTEIQHNYFWLAMMDHLEDNFAHAWTYRGDATYTFSDQDGWLKAVDFGYRGADKQAVTRQTGYNWSMVSALHDQTWMSPVALDATGFPGGTQNSALPHQSDLYNFESFFGGNAPGTAWYPSVDLLSQGTGHVFSLMKDAEPWGQDGMGGWGWVPYSVKAGCPNGSVNQEIHCLALYGNGHPEADNISAGINDQHEKINSGYVMLDFGHDGFLNFNNKIDGNVGVRIVSTTDSSSDGTLLVPGGFNPASCLAWQQTYINAGEAPNNCTDINNAGTFSGGGNQLGLSVNNNYVDVLPSFNARVQVTDELQWRFAASKAIVRPDFSQMQNFTQLSFGFGPNNDTNDPYLPGFNPALPPTSSADNHTGEFATNGTAMTGTGGNPQLKPMSANQYDTSIEWYFAPTGSLTLAVFHKDLKNYFLTGTDGEQFTSGGITYTFGVQRYFNGAHGSVGGFELAYQQFYDFLPGAWSGIGLQANYTKIYNNGGANPTVNNFESPEVSNAKTALPLEGMSPDSYNIAAMYEKYGISARLAYNWRSSYLLTSSAANVNQPVWSEAYGQVDASIFYTFMDHYKIGVQATNLLKNNTILDVGYADYHPRYDWIETDRKVAVILRANW
jgi:TonB-dependent receptor